MIPPGERDTSNFFLYKHSAHLFGAYKNAPYPHLYERARHGEMLMVRCMIDKTPDILCLCSNFIDRDLLFILRMEWNEWQTDMFFQSGPAIIAAQKASLVRSLPSRWNSLRVCLQHAIDNPSGSDAAMHSTKSCNPTSWFPIPATIDSPARRST